MTPEPEWIHTYCPLDDSDDADVEVLPATFDPAAVNPDTFSARRSPDRVHYRMVRNRRTGCLRADPVLSERTILEQYRQSTVNCGDVLNDTTETYLRYAERVWGILPDRRGVLEIGCGPGRFLARVSHMGFNTVAGIEPSEEARNTAPTEIRDAIRAEPLHQGMFAPESFSLVCGFQVLDHLLAPNAVLDAARHVLAPGGVMFWICHDVGHWSARLLRERSPIYDIEHVVLYSRDTIRALFAKNGFRVHSVFGVANRYPLSYWLHLAPLPRPVKEGLGTALRKVRLDRVRLRVNLGNMGIVAVKT